MAKLRRKYTFPWEINNPLKGVVQHMLFLVIFLILDFFLEFYERKDAS